MSAERILAVLARKGGGRLLNRAIDRAIPDPLPGARKTLVGGAIGAVATRIALRSVPGAIVVGGAALAKLLHDRRKARNETGRETARASGKDAAEA
jgi:hypothetical protein